MTKTVREQRDELRAIDLDSNNKVAFIEFLLFTYKKTTTQLFTAKPSDHLIAKLEEAIRQYKAVFEQKKKKVRGSAGGGGGGGGREERKEEREVRKLGTPPHTLSQLRALLTFTPEIPPQRREERSWPAHPPIACQ